jgi:hypothetical protein
MARPAVRFMRAKDWPAQFRTPSPKGRKRLGPPAVCTLPPPPSFGVTHVRVHRSSKILTEALLERHGPVLLRRDVLEAMPPTLFCPVDTRRCRCMLGLTSDVSLYRYIPDMMEMPCTAAPLPRALYCRTFASCLTTILSGVDPTIGRSLAISGDSIPHGDNSQHLLERLALPILSCADRLLTLFYLGVW